MFEIGLAAHRRAHAFLTEPLGLSRLAGAIAPVWYAALTRPKAFFRAVDRPDVRVGNALAFAAIALVV